MSPRPSRAAEIVLMQDELLTLADAHERAELTRYRRLAFSFLTFDTATSRLVASLGIQCEMRLDELHRAAQRLGATDLSDDGPRRTPRRASPQHFFIGSHGMAIDELNQAIADAHYSLQFYEHLSAASAAPALRPLLATFMRQKQTEYAMLQEYLASFGEPGYRASAG